MGESIDLRGLEHEDEPPETRYTAFEIRDYRQLIHTTPFGPPTWINLAESYYRAAEDIIDNVVEDKCLKDVEGVAAIFLFRHFLELALKRIVLAGRWLVAPELNATRKQVKEVESIHSLGALWELVLLDAKP